MAQQNDPYFQIRLIDAKNGQELIRIEQDNVVDISIQKRNLILF